jgi:hypothetical protein
MFENHIRMFNYLLQIFLSLYEIIPDKDIAPPKSIALFLEIRVKV